MERYCSTGQKSPQWAVVPTEKEEQTHHTQEYMVKGIRINSRTYMKTLKRLEQQIAFNGEKR